MRLPIIVCVFTAAFLCGCNSGSDKTTPAADNKTAPDSMAAPKPIAQVVNLIGSYVGPFGTNKITLLITKLAGDTVEGRSVVGGNDRPFTGTVKKEESLYHFSTKEPGDDKNDGSFDFNIDENKPDVVTGYWKPYKPGPEEKQFMLNRNSFRYLTDVGVYPQASKRLLAEDDVANMSEPELETMRNEIFARHGYCFKKKDLRQEFEDKDWYIPNTVDVKRDLTDIEKKNIVLIKRYEKYAQQYGDDYGR